MSNIDPNWILVVVTAIYTVATIVICWANWRSSSAAQKQIETMILQYHDSKRARIAIRFDKKTPNDRSIVLENVGKEDADEVTMSIDEEFINALQTIWPNNLLRIGISSTIHIAAGQEFWFFVAFASDIKKMKTTKTTVRVRYKAAGKYYEEVANIDFSQYEFMSEISNKTVSANGHQWTHGLN